MKKLIKAVHKIHLREIQHCPPIETEPETAIAKYIKKKMREAFNAGQSFSHNGPYPEDGFTFDYRTFNEWFKEKYS